MAGGLSRTYKAMPVIVPRRKRVMARKKPLIVKGYTRTGGYYGRFRGRRTRDGELKFKDFASSTAFQQAGAVNPDFTTVAQGVGETERIGKKIVVKSIYLRGVIVHQPTAAISGGNTVRIMIVNDKQANGAAFTVGQVLNPQSYLAHRNLENVDRFRVLRDSTFSMNSEGVNESQKNISMYIKCNIPIEYDSSTTSGAIVSQRSNSIALLMIGDTNNVTVLSYNVRIRYADHS